LCWGAAWYLRPSAAYYGVKKSGEPLHISWDYGFQNHVVVTNDYYQSFAGLTATADVLNFDMTNKYHNAVTLTAGPASSNVAITIPVLTGLTTTYFVKLKLQDSTGNVISDNFYWYSTTPDMLGGHCKWYFCPTRTYANLTSLTTLPVVTSFSNGVSAIARRPSSNARSFRPSAASIKPRTQSAGP